MDKPHILLVEDEIHLARGICFNLEQENCRVSHVESGEEALERLVYDRFALIILDVMLPGMDGFALCVKVRESDTRVPILMLTARSEEGDRITGLASGADDYLTKPFSLNEFLLRVKGMLRRSSWYLEVRMLSLLFQKEGGAVSRSELLERVWGYASDVETRTLDNFIVRFRKYFEPDPGNPQFFQTVRGVGYRFSRKGGG